MSQPIELAVIGAGGRGHVYADYVLSHPDSAKIVAVAEPREYYRNLMAEKHDIPSQRIFHDWKQVAEIDKLADAVIIATHDKMHVEPAEVFANKGYHILLEKPMAPDEEGCHRIVNAAIKNNIIFAVCHVMRYTRYTQKLKEMITEGVIGDVVSIQHLEPVGYWHQAHSFVRGNWKNETESSFMLLAKSCHDIDWLRYIADAACMKVSSFGSLKHFREENKPAEASGRCLDCSYESKCPYSAKRIYLGRAEKGQFNWPVNVLTEDHTTAGVEKALREGPYGLCVYACDNDVVDHQVVNMLFGNDITASFTMTAFDDVKDRKTRIFGTKGRLYGNGSAIEHYDFLTDKTERIEVNISDGTILSGHGGGDDALMENFITAVIEGDKSKILSGPKESLETHLSTFAAEKSRKQGCVVEL